MDFEDNKQPTKKDELSTNMIRFLGGRNTLFVLLSILLIGLIIFDIRQNIIHLLSANSLFFNSRFTDYSCNNRLLFTQTNSSGCSRKYEFHAYGGFLLFSLERLDLLHYLFFLCCHF